VLAHRSGSLIRLTLPRDARQRGPCNLLCIALVLFGTHLAGPWVLGQEVRGFQVSATDNSSAVSNGNYYALVIGIDDYPAPLPKLKTAVADAQAIADVLKKRYGFQVKTLLDHDATRANIIDAIHHYRNTLGPNDNLLIYYAGHGYADHEAEKAYWLPVDADSSDSANRIISDDLTTDIKVLPARHVLLISDSCYSGDLLRDVDAPAPSQGEQGLLNRMLRSRSRTLMASGSDEPVSDKGANGHSVFANAVLNALTGVTTSQFTAEDLFHDWVLQQVVGKSQQRPQYSIIPDSNNGDGDFVFQLLPELVAKPLPPPKDSFVMMNAPAGAEIHIDQQESGRSTGGPYRIKVEPGPRMIEVFLAGYQTWKQTVSVEAGKQADVAPTLIPVYVAPPPPKESFVLMNAPMGAEIHVDQQASGHSTGSPYRIKVEPGQRVVEVFLNGFQPWKQTVSVEAGKQADLVANLVAVPVPPVNVVAPPKDSFVVMNAPAGAEIHVDQQASGHSTGSPYRIKVDPGQRVVEVFLNGYQPWKQTVSIDAGKQADVVANLIPVPAPPAIITPPLPKDSFVMMTAPAGAEIHVDQLASGHSTGGPYRIKVDPGQRVIEVFLAGYEPWKQSVSVDPGKQEDVVAKLVPVPLPVNPQPLRAAPGVSEDDRRQIQQLLDQYASGYSQRQIRQIKALWPSIDSDSDKTIEKFFNNKDFKSVSMAFHLTDASFAGGHFIAECTQTLHYELDGKSYGYTDTPKTIFVVKKPDGWKIEFIPVS
jgi:hypothetical protein